MCRCFDQCDRERAVLAVAIGGGRARLRRIGDQRVGAGRLDLGEAVADRARGHRALHGLGKRIVAAGVENDEPQLLGRLDRDQHAVERERLVIDVGVALELGIHRDQIVGAVDLDAVAGIIDHGDIGIAGAVGEVAQRAPRLGRREILAGIDDIETGILQRRGDPRRVIDGIGERRDVLVGANCRAPAPRASRQTPAGTPSAALPQQAPIEAILAIQTSSRCSGTCIS